MLEEEWKKNFRMPRDVFVKIADLVREHIAFDSRSVRRDTLSVEKQLATTLYFVKDQGSLTMIANTFGVLSN